MKITVVAFDNCMTSAVFGLLDAFGVATRFAGAESRWNAVIVRLATPTGAAIHGFGGHVIGAQCSLQDANDSDVVLLPAIMGDLAATLERERALTSWLRGLVRRDVVLASACTGAFFLAEAQALDGRRVTLNPYYSELFRKRYPRVELDLDKRVIDAGDVICAGSTSAVLDLAIHIVDRTAGHELAVTTAKVLSMGKNPESQRPYLLFVAPRDHGDERVLQLQDWIGANYRQNIGLDTMAGAVNMSLRSLTRRFVAATGMQPMHYVRSVRIETAKRLLERRIAVDQIAVEVGYAEARSFSRAFRAEVGLSPTQYRRKFEVMSAQSAVGSREAKARVMDGERRFSGRAEGRSLEGQDPPTSTN